MQLRSTGDARLDPPRALRMPPKIGGVTENLNTSSTNPEDRASHACTQKGWGVVWVDVDVTALSHDGRGVVDTGDSLNDSSCGLGDCIAPARVSSDSRPFDGTSHWPSAPSVVVSELRRPRTSVACAG